MIVADTSNNGSISSFDAALIAKYVVSSPPFGITGNWKFIPPNRNYATVNGTISNQDYSALLMGEVSGDWNNSGARPAGSRQSAEGGGRNSSIDVKLPRVAQAGDKEIMLPVSVQGVANKGIIAYEFDLRYDPAVILPGANPIYLTSTVSRGLSFAVNAEKPGIIRVAVYGAVPVAENGVLLNLRFTAVGKIGSVSPLTWERIMFNEGEPQVAAAGGQVKLF